MPLSRLSEPSLVCEQILDCIGAIALGIAQSQALNTILNIAVEEVRKILQTDRVVIYRFDPDGSGVVVVESVGSNWTSLLNQTLDDSSFANYWAEAYNQGDCRSIEDIDTSESQPCYLEFLAQFQVRANLIVPILGNPRMPQSNLQKPLWGLLIAHHCSSSRSWQPLEVKLFQQIAMQVAIGFATAQRAIAIGQTQAVDAFHAEVTQRQEAQAKLQASQEFLHSIYEGAANAIFVVDVLPSGEFRFAGLNPAHEQISGLRSEDIKGKSPEQVLPATAAAAVSANYARCVQAETTISYEECLPVEGKEAWWLTTLTPLRDAQSRIYQLTGTSINITDRKQAEEKLTRQKEFLLNVINTNPNLIAVKDWQGRFRLVNQALADMYCTTVEDLIGKTDRDFNSHPAEVEHYLHDDQQVMSLLQSKFIPEEILTSPTGEVHYLQTIKKPLISPDGRTRYVLVTATDITDRKRAEQERDREAAAKHRLFEHIEQQNQTLEAKVQERTAQLSIANQQLKQEITERQQAEAALQESRQRIANILESITDAFFALDREWQFTYLNPKAEQLLQRTQEELLGKNVWELFPESVEATFYRDYHKAISEGVSVAFEEFYPPLNIWLEVRAYPMQEGLTVYFRDITHRKRAEEALRQSESRFRRLFESNIVGIVFADFSGSITHANDLFLQMVGYTREDLRLGKVCWDKMTPPEYRHLDQQAIEQSRTTRVCAPWEKEFIRPDGTHVPVVIGGALLDGFDDHVIAFVLDISDRKRVEEELRKSEERWQLAVKGNNEGIWDLNLKTNQVFRSARYKEILGYQDHELGDNNDDWVRRIHPDDFERVMQVNHDYLARKIPDYAVEYRLRCQNGSYKWVLGRAQAVWDQAGRPVRMVGSTTDISDRKQAEEALRESERQFRQIFQDASIGMALTDFQSHQFIQVNPAWCRLLGYSTSEIVSLTFDQITHPDDWPQDLPDLRQRDPGKLDSYRLQKRYFKKNGELMWANLTVTVLREQEGLPRFTLAMIEDITERKQAEELIQASLLEKETLLKEIHHRVKNNLQIISSLLRLQSRQIQDQQTLELFKESQNRVQAMALIHEKLYQSSNLAQIDFQEYITTLVEHLCRSYDIHQPAITIKINVEPVPLPIDTAIPCGLIINELVSNSLKYAFPGNQGGEICLKLQFGASSCNAPVDTEQFILTVRDNGIGLPEHLDFRNTSSLGLQLVCRLAKQIRGSLELNRRQGTEFNLVFAL